MKPTAQHPFCPCIIRVPNNYLLSILHLGPRTASHHKRQSGLQSVLDPGSDDTRFVQFLRDDMHERYVHSPARLLCHGVWRVGTAHIWNT